MTISKEIRRARKALKAKQRDIAKSIGVSVDTYRRWEQGKHDIKAEKLVRLAEVLGVSLDEIVG